MTQWNKLEVERVEIGDPPVIVYRLLGVLTNSHESYAFLEQLSQDVRHGHNRVVLNLERLEHMTSAGVGIAAACYTSVTNAKGRIHLAAVPARSRMLLNVVHLLELLGESPTEEEAVQEVGN